MILNAYEIKKRIDEHELLKNYIDLDTQLTPNGFDLTVEVISEFLSFGSIDFNNKERVISETREIEWKNGWICLRQGVYKVRTNEIVKIPLDLVAIGHPRSSLLRSGATVDTGVWDAGFEGKSEFLLIVENQNGFRIKKSARVVQLIFLKIRAVQQGYDGVFINLA